MTDHSIIGALIGLVGAVSNNGKTENTDGVIRQALLACADSKTDGVCTDAKSKEKIGTDEIIGMIHDEKFRIAPDCRSCACPCGNTSDYDMSRIDKDPEELRALKEQLIIKIAEEAYKDTPLPENIYKALAYIGYELKEPAYRELLDELNCGRMPE